MYANGQKFFGSEYIKGAKHLTGYPKSAMVTQKVEFYPFFNKFHVSQAIIIHAETKMNKIPFFFSVILFIDHELASTKVSKYHSTTYN